MSYPIVHVKTKDDKTLFGLFLESSQTKTIFIHTHGTASNFYEEYFVELLSKKMVEKGISFLSANNRGATVYDAYEKTGTAVELFTDCVKDLDVWIEFAIERGYNKIILSGHSLGTEKVVYYTGFGAYANKISAVILFAPADSLGSHYLQDGEPNTKTAQRVERMLKMAEDLISEGKKDEFLPRDAYGSHDGISPKSAESFIDFLGSESKLIYGLPYHKKKLETFAKITVPIFVLIGDQYEFTALPIEEALKLMESENPNTETALLKNANHDFEGKEIELVELVDDFIAKHSLV